MSQRGSCIGGCREWAAHKGVTFGCCNSCHDDEDAEPGWWMIDSDPDADGNWYRVCCAAWNAVNDKPEVSG